MVCNTGSSKNKNKHAIGCEYIHTEADGCQLMVQWAAGIHCEPCDQFIAAQDGKHPRSTKASVHTVRTIISNNASFRLKHLGVPDGSDSSDGTSYPLTKNYKLPVAQGTGRVAYLPALLCAWYTHHQNDTCVTLFAGAAVML